MLGYSKVVQVVKPENVSDNITEKLAANKDLCDQAGIEYHLVSDLNHLLDVDVVFMDIDTLKSQMGSVFMSVEGSIDNYYEAMLGLKYTVIHNDALYVDFNVKLSELPVLKDMYTHICKFPANAPAVCFDLYFTGSISDEFTDNFLSDTLVDLKNQYDMYQSTLSNSVLIQFNRSVRAKDIHVIDRSVIEE